MVKKRRNREKKKANPPKSKFIYLHDRYYRKTLAPLEKEYQIAMRNQNYDRAGEIYRKIQSARDEYRRLILSKEKIKI